MDGKEQRWVWKANVESIPVKVVARGMEKRAGNCTVQWKRMGSRNKRALDRIQFKPNVWETNGAINRKVKDQKELAGKMGERMN